MALFRKEEARELGGLVIIAFSMGICVSGGSTSRKVLQG
jgi:hypothetical protein